MSLLDFFKKKAPEFSKQHEKECHGLLKDLLEEAIAKKGSFRLPTLGNLVVYQSLKSREDDFIKSFIYASIDELYQFKKNRKESSVYGSAVWDGIELYTQLISQLLRRKIDYSDEELLDLVNFITQRLNKNQFYSGIPFKPLLSKIETNIRNTGLSKPLKSALQALHSDSSSENYIYSDTIQINKQIAFLLQGAPELGADASDALGKYMLEFISSLTDQTQQSAWKTLIVQLIEVQGKATPSEKWIKEVHKIIEQIEKESLVNAYLQFIDIGITLLKDIHKKSDQKITFLSEINHDILKGVIWTCGIINDSRLTTSLDEYGLWAFKKLPGVGAVSVRTGNACLFAFSILPFKEGIATLSKFKVKIKYPSVLKIIDKYIGVVALKEGYTKDQLEEISVPSFGLNQGRLESQIGDYTAIVNIKSYQSIALVWEQEGKQQTSVPTKIKEGHKEELAALKKRVKEIESTLQVQKDRIEQCYLKAREWSLEEWKQSYLHHPLLSFVGKQLIWTFTHQDQGWSGIYLNDELVNAQGQPLPILPLELKVSLWHPIYDTAESVRDWRTFLEQHQIKQPFKQAFREVYLLTDAEQNTHTYSNRFAAHILRQHQFAALCKQRGWAYQLMGAWDSHNTPIIRIPYYNLSVEFMVDADWQEENTNQMGIYHFVSTDQVRFSRDFQVLPLEEVPAIVFSEIMRDVDLFVGVTSIGNDVNWQDNGNTRMNEYWYNYSFAELSESSKVREAALQRLIPRLKIAPQCTFDGRYLVVKGTFRTYKIHIGSGNILMSPNDQYLCIVPDKSTKGTDKVFLPFEGDALLSIILSKAILLAEDDKIKDTSILSQIHQA
jgi:hypothetical protein